MQWMIAAISRNGTDWSVRIDNGNGVAFELPLHSGNGAGLDAIELRDYIARYCPNMHATTGMQV